MISIGQSTTRRLLMTFFLSLMVVLSGCSPTEIGQRQTYTPPTHGSVSTQPNQGLAPLSPQPLAITQTGKAVQPRAYPKNIGQTNASSAVKALFAQAERYRTRGNLSAAGNALERAVQLDPDSAFAWNALATLDLRRKKYQRAEAEASKSISVANGDAWLDAANWKVVAEARQGQGNVKGAREARTRAAQITNELPLTR